MYDVMQGVRVIEVAEHTFGPAAGVVLADWGADVVKVERVAGGDPARSLRILQRPGQKRNGFFEVANRGKRSVALDLRQAAARALLHRMIESADVFLTNLRAAARTQFEIEAATLLGINPALVYARATAYGTAGPMADDGGFDYPSSWCRSGSAYVQAAMTGGAPPLQPGSIGNLTGGATLAGAIAAALFRRERTGRGGSVDHSLYAMGVYIMTQSIAQASLAPVAVPPAAPSAANALIRNYRTRDGRWLNICFLQDRWFADFARRIGRPDLLDDPRFADEAGKYEHGAALADALDATFAARDFAAWRTVLDGMDGVWAPIFSKAEVLADPQAMAGGALVCVSDSDGDTYVAAATPGRFDEQSIGELRASPSLGEHTEALMLELGLAADTVDDLRARGVLA